MEKLHPKKRFGPGVSMAHRLAKFWPKDTIGIIKVASGEPVFEHLKKAGHSSEPIKLLMEIKDLFI